MLGRTRGQDELRAELSHVQRRIRAHPFSSEGMRKAQDLVEEMKSRHQESSQIDAALTAEDLPSLQQQGLMVARRGFSWARLHRRRKKLEDRLSAER